MGLSYRRSPRSWASHSDPQPDPRREYHLSFMHNSISDDKEARWPNNTKSDKSWQLLKDSSTGLAPTLAAQSIQHEDIRTQNKEVSLTFLWYNLWLAAPVACTEGLTLLRLTAACLASFIMITAAQFLKRFIFLIAVFCASKKQHHQGQNSLLGT